MANAGSVLSLRGFSVATLQAMLANVNTAITTILTAGQTYRIGPREFTQANLGELEQMANDIQSAIDYKNGARVKSALVDYSNRGPR
jgi:hypothetical protein